MPAVANTKIGRPPGKKSDAAYIQLTSYITRNNHNAIKLELLRDATDAKKHDMSDRFASLGRIFSFLIYDSLK